MDGETLEQVAHALLAELVEQLEESAGEYGWPKGAADLIVSREQEWKARIAQAARRPQEKTHAAD